MFTWSLALVLLYLESSSLAVYTVRNPWCTTAFPCSSAAGPSTGAADAGKKSRSLTHSRLSSVPRHATTMSRLPSAATPSSVATATYLKTKKCKQELNNILKIKFVYPKIQAERKRSGTSYSNGFEMKIEHNYVPFYTYPIQLDSLHQGSSLSSGSGSTRNALASRDADVDSRVVDVDASWVIPHVA